jgi:hypothetical protein
LIPSVAQWNPMSRRRSPKMFSCLMKMTEQTKLQY